MSSMDSCFPRPTCTPWWCRDSLPKSAPASAAQAATACRVMNSAAVATTACGQRSRSCRRTSSNSSPAMKGQAVQNSSRLALYHCWIAFAVFLPAVALGAWQMLMRSPLPAPLDDPNAYYTSVTLHGTAMAYVITTFFAMGFGYAVTATSLGRPVRGVTAAWIGFVICVIGAVMAVVVGLFRRA